jgi:segregation and condensation protein A
VSVELVQSSPQPLARVRGAPLHELPADLYIPPDALEVFLDTFEGPLDLLLYLIRKANLDVLDIPMARLTAQYLEYVEAMRDRNLELAAEYLVMAAMLMEIKSRMLLPRPRAAEEAEADPRAELVRRLLEYERMKLAAQALDRVPQRDRDFCAVDVWVEQAAVDRLPQVHPRDLENAWRSLLARARLRRHHKVTRDELSVRSHMSEMLRKLAGGAFRDFLSLFEPWRGVAVLVVNFLALLELAREGLIEVTQAEAYAPIYVRLTGGDSPHDRTIGPNNDSFGAGEAA